MKSVGIDVSELTYKILQAPIEGAEASTVFRFWSGIWCDTFSELSVDKSVCHGDFEKYDEYSVLFSGPQPVGLVSYRWFDLNRDSDSKDDYWDTYQDGFTQILRACGHENVMVMSSLSVHPEWRKSRTNLPMSEVLIGLAVKRFLQSESTALVSFTRNNRMINDVVYRHGAMAVRRGVIEYNVKVDTIVITRDRATQSSLEGVSDCVELVWGRYIGKKESALAATSSRDELAIM